MLALIGSAWVRLLIVHYRLAIFVLKVAMVRLCTCMHAVQKAILLSLRAFLVSVYHTICSATKCVDITTYQSLLAFLPVCFINNLHVSSKRRPYNIPILQKQVISFLTKLASKFLLVCTIKAAKWRFSSITVSSGIQ